MSKRIGPEESATDFEEFTIKRGNDKNIWVNISDKNSLLKWRKLCDLMPNGYFKLNFNLIQAIAEKISTFSSFVKIGQLDVSTKLVIGDSVINEVEGFGKGVYNIYNFCRSAIATKKKNLTTQLLSHMVFKDTGNVGVDLGVFMYRDLGTLFELSNFATNVLERVIDKQQKDQKPHKNIGRRKRDNSPLKIHIKMLQNIKQSKKKGISYNNRIKPLVTVVGLENHDVNYADKIFFDTLIEHTTYHRGSIGNNLLNQLREEFLKKFSSKNVLSAYISNGWGDGIFPVIVNKEKDTVIQLGAFLSNIYITINDVIEGRTSERNTLLGIRSY